MIIPQLEVLMLQLRNLLMVSSRSRLDDDPTDASRGSDPQAKKAPRDLQESKAPAIICTDATHNSTGNQTRSRLRGPCSALGRMHARYPSRATSFMTVRYENESEILGTAPLLPAIPRSASISGPAYSQLPSHAKTSRTTQTFE
jgi:hypothetical protein